MRARDTFALTVLVGVTLLMGGFFFWKREHPTPPRVVVATVHGQVTPTASPTPIPSPAPQKGITGVFQTRILMYHYIRTVDATKDPLGFRLSIQPTDFANQVQLLAKAGFHTETMAQVAAGLGGAKSIALTFDDGYEDFYTTAWPILKANGFTATIYIISGKVGTDGYMTWSQLKELAAGGVEVGAHTVHHFDLAKMSPTDQQAEIAGSKADIERNTGLKLVSFCYPSGKYTAVTEAITKAAGFSTATTTEPGSVHYGDDPFALHRVRISPEMGIETFQKEVGL